MSTCPNGHQSATADFCDVCGAPIASTASGSGPLAPPISPPVPATGGGAPVGSTVECPNCHTQNPADAMFCEDCGYDFATGQLPPPPEQIDPVSGVVSAASPAPTPAAPAAAGALTGVDWVAEIWVDPDWFASQQAAGACPTSGLPTVVPLPDSSALIGRASKSRDLNPEIDCSGDGAISHSHAELDLANGRWSVKDLGSTNGTFVGRPDGTFPTSPLSVRQPHELADDERIYLGAWTRIIVRRATDAERAGTA
jgi:hypothetical protein